MQARQTPLKWSLVTRLLILYTLTNLFIETQSLLLPNSMGESARNTWAILQPSIGQNAFGQEPVAKEKQGDRAAEPQAEPPVKEEAIEGDVTKVIDGDSIKVRTTDGMEYEIQIEGTDAPELKQPFGKESAEALQKMLGTSKVKVTWQKKDNFERLLAQVYVEDKHINSEMIRTGNAWHFKRYNQSKKLADLEIEAKKEKLGLWGTDNPQAPWDYRKENRAPDKPDR
ncbi:MAG: Endonuclease YhcR precursor [Planctomycetota bacterium]